MFLGLNPGGSKPADKSSIASDSNEIFFSGAFVVDVVDVVDVDGDVLGLNFRMTTGNDVVVRSAGISFKIGYFPVSSPLDNSD